MSISSFTLVEPLVIDSTKYGTWDELAEPDTDNGDPSTAWVSGTTYAQGDRRYYNHKIYERAVAGAGTTTPDLDTANWLYVSPTNKWKMFDASNSTQTVATSYINGGRVFSLHVTLASTDFCDTVVFDNVDADVIRLTAYSDGGITQVFDESVMLRNYGADNWWDYYFQPWSYSRSAVFSGIPRAPGLVFAITVQSNSGINPKIGTLVFGSATEIGMPQYGASTGIIDYSKKDADTFGNYNVVERGFSKRMSVQALMDWADLDSTVALLSKYRAKPAMFLGVGDKFSSTTMYGFYRQFDVVIPYYGNCLCNFDIEGLT